MLTPDFYRQRFVDEEIADLLKKFGAVCIQGPKWCGKTWSSLNQARSVTYLADPANGFSNRNLAMLNPEYALEGDSPHLIDEWQEVPQVWDAVRFAVDKTPRKGRFLLTGSSTPSRKGVLHSGAGRIATINMQTMSLYETGDSSGQVSFAGLFDGDIPTTKIEEKSVEELIALCVRGGWPAVLGEDSQDSSDTASQYLESVINDDVYRVSGTRHDVSKLRALIHSLARNTATTVSNRTLLADMRQHEDVNIHEGTVAEYLNVLSQLFLTWDQPSFHPNLRSSRRVLRAPKRHFADPSLAVAALGASPQMLLRDLQTFGYVFESLVEHDLNIYARASRGNLYHFRDEKGNEIDAVAQLPDGRWGAFEIKLGMNRVEEGAQNLKRIATLFAREMEKDSSQLPPSFLAVICGIGNVAYTRADGVMVVPLTALRN